MDYKEQFESPLPIINKNTDKIYVETSNNHEGSLIIKNDGGGEISGRIMSNSRFINFEPNTFNGNDSKIKFYINLDIYNPGEVFKTNAVVMSNGGEYKIEFTVKIIPHAIVTKEGNRISSLKEFYNYAKKHPIQARQLFSNHEFMMYLHSSGYEYMDMYEKFVVDSNKERALDNFLIFNKLKHKAEVDFHEKSIIVEIPVYENKIKSGIITIKKSGWGYIESEITNNNEWLSLGKNLITSSDFDERNKTYINYVIDPLKLNKKVSHDKIIIDGKKLIIKVIKIDFIEVKLKREFYEYRDEFNIEIENNSGGKLPISIFTKDSFVKFEASNYIVNVIASIPFTINIPVIQSAQVMLTKQPIIESEIYVESRFNKNNYRKVFKIIIGYF